MALAIKCDCCGSYFTPYRNYNGIKNLHFRLSIDNVTFQNHEVRNTLNVDICDDCYVKIKNFMENLGNAKCQDDSQQFESES